MAGPTSCAWATCALRGSPRKTTPKAFVKHAAASPPIKASAVTTASAGIATEIPAEAPASSAPRKIRNSLTKPFSGGSPEMAMAPHRKYTPVDGMRLRSPPR